MKSVNDDIINWDIVTVGETEEDKILNAKYVISITRLLGAVVFCLWNDITEVKPKMILTLVGALAKIALSNNISIKPNII